MKDTPFPRPCRVAIEFGYSLALLAWFTATWCLETPGRLLPAAFPFEFAPRDAEDISALAAFVGAAFVAWVPVAIALAKLAALLFARRRPWARADSAAALGLGALQSALVVASFAVHAAAYAAKPRYFVSQSPFAWGILALSLAYNALCIGSLIAASGLRNPEGVKAQVLPRFGSPRGIQHRLTSSFSAFILVIIAAQALLLLRDFNRTLLAQAIDKGESLAEGAAAIAKASIQDAVGLEDYFALEADKNEHEAVPFDSMVLYLRDPTTGALVAAYGTDEEHLGEVAPVGVVLAVETEHLFDRTARTVEFRAPLRFDDAEAGYVSVIYEIELILEPYFRTQVKVLILAAVFLYAAVFLTYLIGRSIVLPILYLRTGVASVSSRLAAMMRGETAFSAGELRYEDRVGTKDEIKQLSVEIGGMTGLIRGMVPYLSASTLRHAAGAAPLSERREQAFLFTDIRGFTTLCEGLPPEEIVALLNRYLELQAAAIHEAGGEIDKFVGDEVMAVFSGPDKELKACHASLRIQRAMAEERRRARAAFRTEISVGVGINAGPVVFGAVGSSDRRDFTSIGDTVNLAARLEGANKIYGTSSLVSEAVKEKVSGELLLREIDLLTVRGKTRPERVYEVIQERSTASPRLALFASVFEAGLAAYRARRWDAAERAFQPLVARHADEPSAVFLRRIARFRAEPPSVDWDGVFDSGSR